MKFMKLKSLYSFLLATALVACNEDFNEGIAGYQTNDPEDAAASMTVKNDTCSYPWLDLSYVKKERFILQHSNQSIRQLEEDALLYADVLPELTYKISSIDAGVRLAEQGYGIAFTLNSYLSSMKLSDNSAIMQVGDPNLLIPFSAAYRKEDSARREIHEWIKLTCDITKNKTITSL